MREIKVSVIVPVYNSEAVVERCINSVVAQTLKDIEIICVDDGSEDNSAAILKKLSFSDRRITFLAQTNQYAGVARNNGLKHSSGKYVTFLDADDVYCSDDVLEVLLDKAEAANADMVKGSFKYLEYSSGKTYTDCFSLNKSVSWLIRKDPDFRRSPERFIHASDVPWNGLYRREFLLENCIEFNRLICVNDHSFYIHCLLKAKRIVFVSKPTVFYTVSRTGSLIAEKPEHFTAQIESYKIVRKICSAEPQRVRQSIMKQELMGVFGLFNNLGETLHSRFCSCFCDFLREMDQDDVGIEYLEHFQYAEQYFMLRYGKEIKRKQYPLAKKLFTFVKEHGLRCTWDMALKRISA